MSLSYYYNIFILIITESMFNKFEDRKQAGEQLAEKLTEYKVKDNVLVIAIPRGGIELAVPVAKKLNTRLDVFVTRKIGAPDNEEYAIGALSETGEVYLKESDKERYSEEEINKVIEKEKKEAKKRVEKYRGHELPSLKDKIVILVDDGLATGSTMLVAVQAIKEQSPETIVVAVPVSPPDSVKKLEYEADEVIVLNVSNMFFAVGQFYKNFPQTTDEKVAELMKEYKEG
jgi:putative phosphoribosyl transferase